MKIKKNIIILFSLIIFFVYSSVAFAAGIKPLVVNIDAQPGDTKNFELTLLPGTKEEQVNFSFYQPIQLVSGGLTYQKTNDESFPASNWVELEQKEVMVYPGQENIVSATVKVPFNAGGSHTVVIMVEPQTPSRNQSGVKVMVRYAVRVNIRIKRPGLRPKAKLVNFGLSKNEEEEPIIKAKISNPSAWDYLASGEVTIRDSKRRLIERINLKTPSGMKNNSDKTRIYPGSKVKYLGDITKRLDPGKYNLRVFFKYADHSQIIKEKTIQVKQGQFDFPSIAEIGAFSVKPKQLNLELKPGQRKSKVLRLNSEIGDNARVVVTTSNIEHKYKYSLVDWIKLRGRSKFKLRARKKGQVILTTAVPQKVKPGSYHGNIMLKAFKADSKKVITKKEVPVSVLVGDKHNYKVEVKSLYTKQVDNGQLLSLDVYNSGNVFMKPHAEVIIKGSKDKFVGRVQLTAPKDQQKLLPLTSKRLRGTAKKLKPGQYKAEIKVKRGGNELKTVTKKFKVK